MMFFTNKKDILNAMKKDIEGASDSTISWLADVFNVPLHPKQKVSEREVFDCPSVKTSANTNESEKAKA